MTYWIGLGIVLPSLPIVIGTMVTILQGIEVSFTDLLDGIELFLISLVLVTATYIDLSKTELNWSSHFLFYFFIRAVLFVLGALNLIFLTLIYINNRVTPLDFDPDLNLLLAIGYFVLIGIITTPLQFYIGYTSAQISPRLPSWAKSKPQSPKPL